MEIEEHNAIVATYAQLLADAQRGAITAQVQLERARRKQADTEQELQDALHTIEGLKNPPLPMDEPDE